MKRIAIIWALALAGSLWLNAAVVDVTAFGAKGDGKTQNREAINKAIETVAAAGGGTVEFPAGTWVTGSVRLRSNVSLHLERGTREHRDRWRRTHFSEGIDARRARRRRRQSHRAETLSQRDPARFLNRQRRALWNTGDRNRQSDHRQHHDRYQPRWHRRGLVPQCPYFEFQYQRAQRRCDHAQGNARSGSGAGQRKHHDYELPGQRIRNRVSVGRNL